MKTIEKTFFADTSKYPYEKLGDIEKLLFIDIETTGFVANGSKLYLIGCAYHKDNSFHTIQWFAEGSDEEEEILYAFTNFAANYNVLIHYNGNHFDIPYLEAKLSMLDMDFDFRALKGIDIFRRLFPYKTFMKLENLKLKTIERFCGINRDDKYDGGELISVYNEYLRLPQQQLLEKLLTHNQEDLCGLVNIIPALAIPDMFNENIKVTKASKAPCREFDGSVGSRLTMEFTLPSPLPSPLSYGFEDCYFTGEGQTGRISVSIREDELKLFYPNYKDYYFLPEEDEAIHKSLASFVDSAHRQTAKASNCYKKLKGVYLPQWEPLFTPIFRENYRDRTMYFALTDEIKKDSRCFTRYAAHLLQTMAHPIN